MRLAPWRDGPWITETHWHQFRTDGYMVIRGVIPTRITRAAVRDVAAFIGANLEDKSTWYWGPPELDGLIPLHHAQSLWDIRQCPNLHSVFAEFFGTDRLLVDMNRCIFRPPMHPDFPGRSQGTIHWDTDPRTPGEGSLQAVILLTDVFGPDEGGFQCLPDVFRNLAAWLSEHARQPDFNFFRPGLDDEKTTYVLGKAGDVILWSTRLPHGSASNLSARPRIATFVTMQPCDDQQRIEEATTLWRTKRAPAYWRGLFGQDDPEPGPPAALSRLGQRLIGMRPW
jgi:hypothetical protein